MAELRSAIHVALVTICITAAYEIKENYEWETPGHIFLLVVITYFLTSFVASGLTNALMKSAFIRMLALRRSWIEGYWHIITYYTGDPKSVSHGLMNISYLGKELEIKTTVFKLSAPGSQIDTVSTSQLVALDSRSLQYLNYFNYQIGTEEITGIAQGMFYLDGLRPYPTRYHGILRYFSPIPNDRQIARRISSWRVRKYLLQHRYDWERKLLTDLSSGPATF
jgi:hypothetical protein